MLIIKYGMLASYTKILYSLFNQLENNYNSSKTLLPKDIYATETASLEYVLEGNIPEEKFIYTRFDDKPEFYRDQLFHLKNSPCIEKIVILPLTPIQERITSIITRINAISTKENILCKTLDCFLKKFFEFHILSVSGKTVDELNIEMDGISFEKLILLSEFEKLIELHENNYIKLILVSKDTIINKPEKILAELGISNHNIDMNKLNTHRMNRHINTEISEVLDSLIKEKNEEISNRVKEIKQLIMDHKLRIL